MRAVGLRMSAAAAAHQAPRVWPAWGVQHFASPPHVARLPETHRAPAASSSAGASTFPSALPSLSACRAASTDALERAATVTPRHAAAPAARRSRPGGAALPAARAALIRPSTASPAAEPHASSLGVPPSPDDEIGRALAAAAEQRARLAAALADESRWRLVIDCGFVHTLTAHKELRSLAKQIQTSVGHNRRAEAPFCLQVTSWFGEVAEYAEGTMGGAAWPLLKRQQATLDLFPRELITVLSPDAAEPLTDLDPDRVYVVGGIVDKSVIRGVTAGFAARHELRAARLPTMELAEQLALGPGAPKRPVLNIDDVVYALLRYRVNGGDWLDALDAAIPARKRGARRAGGGGGDGDSSGPAGGNGSGSDSGGSSGSGSG